MIDVVWDEAALEELADIWVGVTAPERDRIEAAIVRLNERLKRDPVHEGESRSGNVRVTIVSPITVWFHCEFDIDSVVVYHVVLPKRRP